MTEERKQRTWTRDSKHTTYKEALKQLNELRKDGYVLNERAEDSDKAVKIRRRSDASFDVMTSPRRPA